MKQASRWINIAFMIGFTFAALLNFATNHVLLALTQLALAASWYVIVLKDRTLDIRLEIINQLEKRNGELHAALTARIDGEPLNRLSTMSDADFDTLVLHTIPPAHFTNGSQRRSLNDTPEEG